jgi:Predicted metal binding domain
VSAEVVEQGPALRRPRHAQYVEPEVSRSKFEREISEFHELRDAYTSRGWVLSLADFPIARVLLCATQLKPPAVVIEVEFDFTNYDVEPPSVTLLEPFTHRPYRFSELPTVLKRSIPGQPQVMPPGLPQGLQVMMSVQQPLMQSETPEAIPFLCIAGVREYHEHPAHSGDVWGLHRESGAGRLVRLLEVIHRYGVEPISDYQIQLSLTVAGFIQGSTPE